MDRAKIVSGASGGVSGLLSAAASRASQVFGRDSSSRGDTAPSQPPPGDAVPSRPPLMGGSTCELASAKPGKCLYKRVVLLTSTQCSLICVDQTRCWQQMLAAEYSAFLIPDVDCSFLMSTEMLI